VTTSQYYYLLGVAANTKMQFIVWNGSAYRMLEATLPERKWACGIDNIHPNNSPQRKQELENGVDFSMTKCELQWEEYVPTFTRVSLPLTYGAHVEDSAARGGQ
jgi:hypothetical protein